MVGISISASQENRRMGCEIVLEKGGILPDEIRFDE